MEEAQDTAVEVYPQVEDSELGVTIAINGAAMVHVHRETSLVGSLSGSDDSNESVASHSTVNVQTTETSVTPKVVDDKESEVREFGSEDSDVSASIDGARTHDEQAGEAAITPVKGESDVGQEVSGSDDSDSDNNSDLEGDVSSSDYDSDHSEHDEITGGGGGKGVKTSFSSHEE
jgi:hypothetical protein